MSDEHPRAPAADSRALRLPPPPRLTLARSLDEARPGMLVHVDRRGQVRSPERFHFIRRTSLGFLAVSTIALAVLYTTTLGPVGGLLIAALAVWIGRSVWNNHLTQRAAVLLSLNRIEEAEQILRRLLRRRLPKLSRALVHQNLAAVHSRRGEHDAALSNLHQAIHVFRAAWRRRLVFPWLRMCQYAEVSTLCSMGRILDARDRFKHVGPEPEGDMLVVMRHSTELYLQFCEQRLDLDEHQLWERAQRGLRMTYSAVLLALCAWGYEQRGDLDLAWHLLHEAFERRHGFPIEHTNPDLWRWMQSHEQDAARARAEREQSAITESEPKPLAAHDRSDFNRGE